MRLAWHQDLGKSVALTAPYSNHPESTFWGAAYNAVTLLWMARGRRHAASDILPGETRQTRDSGRDETRHFLGGNFSLAKVHALQIRFNSALSAGGKVDLSRQLAAHGVCIQQKVELAVSHRAQHSLNTFFKRAWSHGRAKKSVNLYPVSSVRSYILDAQRVLALVVRPRQFAAICCYLVCMELGRAWERFLDSRTA